MNQTAKQWDVITVGDVFLDIVMTGFARWPQPGEEAFASHLMQEVGGGAAITACGLARLQQRVALLALIGTGGEWLGERLRSCGVADELLHRPGGDYAGLTVSISTPEDRSFLTYRGSNEALTELLREDEATRQELTRARHVHLAFPAEAILLEQLTAELHAAGTTVSLDAGWHPALLTDAGFLAALREVDIFLPNEHEAELMTGRTEPKAILRAFADAGLCTVALKLGANGSALLYEGDVYFAAPHNVTPLDTTGAGDCFDAGFLFAWLNGKVPTECLRIANVCGALSTRALGGIAGFPQRNEL